MQSHVDYQTARFPEALHSGSKLAAEHKQSFPNISKKGKKETDFLTEDRGKAIGRGAK